MGSLILRRVGQAVVVLLGVSFLTFLLLNLLPGNVINSILGPGATPAAVARLRVELGLNQNLFLRYLHWLGSAAHGNLGTSLATGQSVAGIIVQRLPVTAEIVALAGSIPLAFVAARRAGQRVDRLIAGGSLVFISVPAFVPGILLILIFGADLKVLPATGWVNLSQSLGGNLRTAIMPVVTLALGGFAVHGRLLRAELVAQSEQEYATAALARGLRWPDVMRWHVARNSMIPLITNLALHFGALIGGTVIVEQLFGIPGVGQLLINSIDARDTTVVEGIVLLTAVAFMVGNLLADILHTAIDPRVRYAGATAG